MLLVKLNLDYTCVQFFEVLKENQNLLKKISSTENYAFKQKENPNVSDATVDLNMSIE